MLARCCRAVRSAELTESCGGALCGGHRFARSPIGLVDFSTLAPQAGTDDSSGTVSPAEETRRARRSALNRRARRFALLVLSTGYAAFLLVLIPFGLIFGIFRQ